MGTALRDLSGHPGDTVAGSIHPFFEEHAPQPLEPLDLPEPRLAELSDTARILLSAGAVLGRPFSLHEVAGLLSVPPMHLLAAVQESLTHGLLTEHGDALALSNSLTGETVYAALPQPVRRAMHREAARVLEEEGRPAGEVAAQLVRGWQHGERIPGGLLELLRGNHGGKGQLSALLAEVVRLLTAADRMAEARELVDAVLRSGTDPLDLATVVLTLWETTQHPGHARGVAERARSELEQSGAVGGARARLLAARAVGLCYTGDDIGAEIAATEAIALPGPPRPSGRGAAADRGPLADGGDPADRADPMDEVRVVAGLTRSVTARHRGDLRHAVLYARRAVITSRAQPAPHGPHAELWLARALAAHDEFEEAHALVDIGQHDAERRATAWPRPVWQHARAMLYRAAGRLADAEREAQHALWQVGTDGSLYIRLNALLGEIAVQRGDLLGAGRQLRRARQMIALGHCVVDEEDLRWRTGVLQAAEGDPAAALQTLISLYDGLGRSRELLIREPRAAAELVRIALAAEDPARARLVVTAARDLARRNPDCRSLCGAAQHAQGILARSRAALRAAVREYAGSPRLLDQAAAVEDAGTAEHAAGGSRAAVRLLTEAERLYRGAGAEPAVRRTRRLLAEARARRRGAAEGASATGWDSLTEAELRVVRVVAEGLTNKQAADRLFLSPHTVDSHLRHSFAKLGINNRVELACAVMRERSAGPHPENA
jgi:DNA-binding CsgD family transcriptional regulator